MLAKTLLVVATLALAVAAGPNGEENALKTKAKAAHKAAVKDCRAKNGVYDKDTKTCDETNAGAKEACLNQTPPGKWNRKDRTCKDRTPPPFKECKKKFGEWDKKAKTCDETNAAAKQTCTEAGKRWKAGKGDDAPACVEKTDTDTTPIKHTDTDTTPSPPE